MKYKVCTPIEKQDPSDKKPRWHKIGRGWSDDEKRICVVLDSLPFRSNFIYLFEDDEDDRAKKG